MLLYIYSILGVIGLILCDQFTKWIATSHLREYGEVPLIDGVFSLSYVHNDGAAFGILKGGRWFFIPITIIVIAVLVIYYIKLPPGGLARRISLILICGGAIGNLIDRILNGFVIDFLYFSLIDFPVFNFADICVVCGAILFGALMVFKPDKAASS